MPESAEIRALVERGYLHQVDLVPLLGVTHERVSQIVKRDDFPRPARW